MTDDRTDRDYILECALRQDLESSLADVYQGLSEEDRIALARMITDCRWREDGGPWAVPPDEL